MDKAKVTEFLRSLWIGFCHLILILVVIALFLGIVGGFFFLMFVLFWGSLWLLGKTACLILWSVVTVVIASYGMGKEFRKHYK